MTSRPFWSAPSRYCACRPGPEQRRPKVAQGGARTIGVLWPSMTIEPFSRSSFGPMWAKSLDQIGAARQQATMTRNSAPKARAVLFLRSLRQARYQGLRPSIETPLGAGDAALSRLVTERQRRFCVWLGGHLLASPCAIQLPLPGGHRTVKATSWSPTRNERGAVRPLSLNSVAGIRRAAT